MLLCADEVVPDRDGKEVHDKTEAEGKEKRCG
jgi:hypothetical protein